MKLTVIGTGYVGLVTAACFAEMGNTVTCVDKDLAKLEALKAGRMPFYEPGLDDLVARNQREGRLQFAETLVQAKDAEVYFLAVGTPPDHDGAVDLGQVLDAARELGRCVGRDFLVVDKSTVPVGTAEKVRRVLLEELERRSFKLEFDVVSNPEFLKEGDAVNDFMRPERVIVGTDSKRAVETLRALYTPFMRSHERMLVMGLRDAEMTKYVANAMLATRISFMNEIANICERLGVDIENVRRGIGSDSRIGHAFIYPGCGFGGSCLPKDLQGLIHMADASGVKPQLLRAVESRNQQQKLRLFEKIRDRLGPKLDGALIAVWGLAFKPGTDDLREAPSLALIECLLKAGAQVRAYDPVALDNARRSFPQEWFRGDRQLELVGQQYDAVTGADALALVTEWKPFRHPDFDLLRKLMKQPLIFDGRNQYDSEQLLSSGFEYYGIGR